MTDVGPEGAYCPQETDLGQPFERTANIRGISGTRRSEVAMFDLTNSPEWSALSKHFGEVGERHLRQLFADEPDRVTRLTAGAGDLVLDYSKHRITEETMPLFIDLALAAGVEGRRDAMFAGAHINSTEDRAVLHVALRMPEQQQLTVDGQNVVRDVHAVLDHMGDISDRIRNGSWVGATGERIRPWSTSASVDRTLGLPWRRRAGRLRRT